MYYMYCFVQCYLYLLKITILELRPFIQWLLKVAMSLNEWYLPLVFKVPTYCSITDHLIRIWGPSFTAITASHSNVLCKLLLFQFLPLIYLPPPSVFFWPLCGLSSLTSLLTFTIFFFLLLSWHWDQMQPEDACGKSDRMAEPQLPN